VASLTLPTTRFCMTTFQDTNNAYLVELYDAPGACVASWEFFDYAPGAEEAMFNYQRAWLKEGDILDLTD
jgi:hypothetical protein